MRIKRLLLIFLAAVPLQAFSQQREMTLEECLDYAVGHNVTVMQRGVDVDIKSENLKESGNAWLPQIYADAAEQLQHGNAATATGTLPGIVDNTSYGLSYTGLSLSLNMPVYHGGQIRYRKKSDSYSLDNASQNLETAKKEISIQVSVQYLQTLYYKGLAQVSRTQVELSRQLLEEAEVKVAEGKAPESEIANAKAKLAADQYQLSKDEGNVVLSLVKLAQLMNLDTPEGFSIADPELEEGTIMPMAESASDYFDDAVETYPTIQAAKFGIQASEMNVRVAKSKRLPQLDFVANAATNYNYIFNQGYDVPSFGTQFFENNPAQYVALRLRIPIFNRTAYNSEIRRSNMQVTQSQLKLDESRQKLRNDIQDAWYNAKVSVDNYFAALQSREAYELSFKYEREKYESGRSTFLNMKEENQKLTKARQDELQSRYEYLIRKKVLEFYLDEE